MAVVAPIQVFLINLDRSPDRLQFMQEQAQLTGLEFNRIQAIDGLLISAPQDDVNSSKEQIRPAELGCFMSHRKAWQAIYDLGERWGIVLEDDVLISPEFPHVMGSLDWAPPDADIVKFEACPKPFLLYKSHVPLSSRRLYRRKGSLVGGGGYAITRNACELLLKETENDLVMVVDKYLFNRISPVAGRLTTYVMSPALVIQQLYLPLPENEIFPTLISKTPLADRRKPKPPPIMRRIVRTVTRALRPVVQPSTIYRVVDWR